MLGKWAFVTIEDIAASTPHAIAMGPFGSDIKTDNFVPSGVPIIRGVNLGSDRFKDDGFVFLTEEKANELATANAFALDLIFTHRGTIGQVGIIPSTCRFKRYVVSQSQMKLTCDQKKADPRFVYYYFRSRIGQHELLANTSTTGVPAISRPLTSLKSIRIPLPPLSEQKTIAHILGTLDDKIELNRRMNETLEAMARAIFKSWFVDFDPVRAKAEGRDPGLSKSLGNLFPDFFVDSEIGEIPKGWEVKQIGELAEVVGGSTPSTLKSEFWEGGSHCWATPKDLASLTSPVLFDTERRITDAGLAQISSGILPVGTVLLSSRAPIGYLAIAETPVAINQGFIAMKPKDEVPSLFLLLWAHFAHEEILSRANGSTFLEISKSNFRPILVVRPKEFVFHAFDSFVTPLYRWLANNVLESRTLTAIRDTLLSKLISGELRVKDAERFIGKVV